MDLMAQIAVYGFGSFFSQAVVSNDIDILLIHEDISNESCALAISCKRHFLQSKKSLHITMLSKYEERDLDFIERSRAHPIGTIIANCLEEDVQRISRRLQDQTA